MPVDVNITLIPFPKGWEDDLACAYLTPSWFHTETQTWYPAPLANQIAGYNVSPTTRDIRIEMNSNIDWYYGAGNPSNVQEDWITIMLHEVTHGLGFFACIGENGGYYYGTFPNIFTRQLYQGLTGQNITELTQSQRAALVKNNNLYSGRPGSHLLAAHGGVRVKMYSPTTYSEGSSVSHWDHSVTFSTFMTAYEDPGFKERTINPREIAIMRDMGWRTHTVSVSANPAAGGSVTGGGTLYNAGTPVTITASPNTGYSFVNWTTTSANVTFANANSAATSFIMPNNAVTVTANFGWSVGDITATLSGGTLRISGTGRMPDFSSSFSPPWKSSYVAVDTSISKVIIENGVTSIGIGAFNNCRGLIEVTIGNSVTTIGTSAF